MSVTQEVRDELRRLVERLADARCAAHAEDERKAIAAGEDVHSLLEELGDLADLHLIPLLDALAAAEAERGRLRERIEAMEPEWDGLRTDRALLRLALRRLEAANEAACAVRPQAAYDAMIVVTGGADALLELDAARYAARVALGDAP